MIVARHSASCSSNDPKCGFVPNKCVANREWVRVARRLTEWGYMPVAVGSAADRDDERYREWPGARLYGESYGALFGALQAAAAVLCVDCGIRHMAAAAGAHLYCVSGAIPLSLIHCVPVREGQRIVEEHRPPALATAPALSAGARRALGMPGAGGNLSAVPRALVER